MTTFYTLDIYEGFQERFPQSKYLSYLKPKVATIQYYHKYWTSYPEAKEELVFKENTPGTLEELIKEYPNQSLIIHIWPSVCQNCTQLFMYLPQYYSNEALKEYKFIFLYFSFAPNQIDTWKTAATHSRLKGDHYYVKGSLNRDDNYLIKDIYKHFSSTNNPAFISTRTIIVDEEGNIHPEFVPPFSAVEELTQTLLEHLK